MTGYPGPLAASVSDDIGQSLIDAFVKLATEQGLAVAISFMFVFSAVYLVRYLLNVTIKGKDEEIKRLVKLRDELWDQYIKERPGSGASESD